MSDKQKMIDELSQIRNLIDEIREKLEATEHTIDQCIGIQTSLNQAILPFRACFETTNRKPFFQ